MQFNKILFCSFLACMSSSAFADLPSGSQFHVSVDAGSFNGNFNAQYNDLTDTTPQNTAASVNQAANTSGFAFGWDYYFTPNYFLGLELSTNRVSNSANYDSGANSNIFTDETKIKNYTDISLRIGSRLSDLLMGYTKLGISRAKVTDNLSSPVGYNPVITNYSSSSSATGLVFGLGLQHTLTSALAVFAEYDYHDYQKISFQDYTNYTANYSHTATLTTSAVLVGLNYKF